MSESSLDLPLGRCGARVGKLLVVVGFVVVGLSGCGEEELSYTNNSDEDTGIAEDTTDRDTTTDTNTTAEDTDESEDSGSSDEDSGGTTEDTSVDDTGDNIEDTRDDNDGGGEDGLAGYCQHYKDCGGTSWEDAQECVDVAIETWGECRRDEFDAFGNCMMGVTCSEWGNPDSFNPETTECAAEWDDLEQASCN